MSYKKIFFFFAAVLIAASANAKGIEFQHISLEAAKKQAADQGKLIFIDVYATWCGPCKYLSNNIFPDDQLGEYYNEHFISVKIDGEKGEGPALMREFELNAYPSLLFLNAEGVLINKKAGAHDVEKLMGWAKDAVDPENSAINVARTTWKKGTKPKRDYLAYIKALESEELLETPEGEELIASYISKFPIQDLSKEADFYFFFYGVHDVNHALMAEYLENVTSYESKFPPYFPNKMAHMIGVYMDEAIATESTTEVIDALRKMYPALKAVQGENVEELAVIEDSIKAIVDQEIAKKQ